MSMQDTILHKILKNHPNVVKHGYTFDYKYNVLTATKPIADAFLAELRAEFVSPSKYSWDGAYDEHEQPIYVIWI